MKSVEIDVSKLAKQVADDLKEYSEETAKIVDGCIDEVADQCVEKLKATSPRKTGKYAESWKAETVYAKSGNKRVVVRNKKILLPDTSAGARSRKERRQGQSKSICAYQTC